MKKDYPGHPDLAEATCSCKLERISWDPKPAEIVRMERRAASLRHAVRTFAKKERMACRQETSRSCAQAKITDHTDYREPADILKSWHFPPKALRLSYTNGPRSSLHAVGLGVAIDAQSFPGSKFLNLPGRFVFEGRYWDQSTDIDSVDPESCVLCCNQRKGGGGSFQYEQLLTNIFGLHGSVRYFKWVGIEGGTYALQVHGGWMFRKRITTLVGVRADGGIHLRKDELQRTGWACPTDNVISQIRVSDECNAFSMG